MVWMGPAWAVGLSAPAAIVVWCLVLLALMGLMSAAVLLARKRWLTPWNPDDPRGSGFTLERLEALHRGGQISDEEFSRLRRQVLEWMGSNASPASGSSHPPGHDDGNASRTGLHP